MKNRNPHNAFQTKPLRWLTGLFVLLALSTGVFAQTQYKTSTAIIKVLGTSSLHDWSMQSDKGICDATFTLQGNDIKSLQNLNFRVAVNTLHSEHSGLDKNAYGALNAEKYETISFTLTGSDPVVKDKDNFHVACKGNLTVSGVSKPIELSATCKVNADKSITCTGFHLMRMTDHKVEPPKLMLGAIKTGDEIHIDFNVSLKQ